MAMQCSLHALTVLALLENNCAYRYVEDHTNKLVRTLTGNLTAMLHQVQSIRPAFDSSSSGGSSARSRLSMAAGASSSASFSSNASDVQGKAVPAKGVTATSSLSQAMSLPVKSKSAQSLWVKRDEQIQEQASVTSTAIESTGSNSSGVQEDAVGVSGADEQLLVSGKLKGSLAARAAARRSSGSGGKVLGLSDGLEVESSGPADGTLEKLDACTSS